MITELLHRRRLLFWLVRAYLKKRKRTILSFFLAGILVGVLLYFLRFLFLPFLPLPTTTIGVIGSSYTLDSLPVDIENKISLGLTGLTESGGATPSAAISYDVTSDGKKYTFILRDDLFWQDGKKLEASDINYNFKDVEARVENNNTITFILREPYTPFLTVVSQPLFRRGLMGIIGKGDRSYGAYKIRNVDLNGSLITQLVLEGNTTRQRIIYKFYSNEEEAKIHFMLGDVDTLSNIINPGELANWKNIHITKRVSYDQLVTVFYNTSLPLLSDKSVRQALTYALPSDFSPEEKAASPLSKTSWAYSEQTKFAKADFEAAKKLLSESEEATQSASIDLKLTTTPRFADLAEKIKENWAQIGVKTDIEVVDTISKDPQVLLERFKIPTDPDQYILWHSTQATNISHFASPKIDKLLEDGRQAVNQEDRREIYADFQRFLIDESPAAFLYYPTVYTVSRK